MSQILYQFTLKKGQKWKRDLAKETGCPLTSLPLATEGGIPDLKFSEKPFWDVQIISLIKLNWYRVIIVHILCKRIEVTR